MKAWPLFGTLLLLSAQAFAVDLKEFNQRWAHTPLLHTRHESTTHQTKVFKRYVWSGTLPIAVNESVVTVLKNAEGKTDLKDLTAKINASFGGKLNVTATKERVRLHGPFQKMNRMLDISLEAKEQNFMVVTSFTRLGFAPVMEKEVNELHKLASEFFHGTDKRTTSWWHSVSLIPTAHAQITGIFQSIFGGANNTTGSGNPASSIGTAILANGGTTGTSSSGGPFAGAQDSVDTLNTNIGNLGTAIDTQGTNVSTSIGGLSTSISTTGDQLSTTINNTGHQVSGSITGASDQLSGTINNASNQLNGTISNTGNQVSGQLGNLSDSISNTGDRAITEVQALNATAERQGQQANDNWAQSNRLLAKAVDPNHMARVAFYSAAGAALGSLTINLALQGVSKGIGALWELFTHEKKLRMEWNDFQKAMEVWDTQLNDLIQMERIVDDFLAAFEFFKNKNLGTDYPHILSTAIRDMNFDRELFLERFRDDTQDRACRAIYFNAAEELKQRVGQYQQILDLAHKTPMVSNDPEAYFCGQLADLHRRILQAEQNMQKLRLHILVAEQQYFPKEEHQARSRERSADRVEDRLNRSFEQQRNSERDEARRLREEEEDRRSAWLRACRRGENPEGQQIKAKRSLGYFGLRRACREAYRPTPVAARGDTSLEQQVRQGLTIRANDYIDAELSTEQERWFAKIHMDAHCYEFAHDPAGIPAECRQYPETLYSIGLSGAADKAKEAYDRSCEDRYQKGLQSIIVNRAP